MIDLTREAVYPIREIPARLEKRGIMARNGKAFPKAAICRWYHYGVSGRRLEVIHAGGSTYTSDEACLRFFYAISNARKAASKVASKKAQTEVEAKAKKVAAGAQDAR